MRSHKWSRLVILTLFLLALYPSAAHALSVSAPADVLDKVDVQASLTASDGAGLAMLYVDDVLVRSQPASAGPRAIAFTGVGLRAGRHNVRVLIRTAEGIVASPRRAVTSWRKPTTPVLVSPAGGAAARYATVVAKAGANTASLKLFLNGRLVTTKAASPGQSVTLAKVTLASGTNTIVVEGTNPVSSQSGTFKVTRIYNPWPTCIVIDKSDYRLYWIRNEVLVKTYPIAIGKPSTPTPARNWKVGAKYVYSSWGIYGPRRLRLYKQVGTNSFSYTGYGIHGTNQEWVIGTMASHGCIRMYNRDVLELYPQVPMGTMVQTRE